MAERKAQDMENTLKDLLSRRTKGEISLTDFYAELLSLLRDVADSLRGELEAGMDEEAIKEQIPLILTILREQIGGLKNRGR